MNAAGKVYIYIYIHTAEWLLLDGEGLARAVEPSKKSNMELV
jgi:hypothetical protein